MTEDAEGVDNSPDTGAADAVDRPARRRRSDGEITRARVLQAAVDSILEKGYYRTSSNEIARRAGVTWGTLQHQFGSREGLLLEVLDDRWRSFQEMVGTARLEGSTLEERLASLLEVLATHYSRPAELAQLLILLDLSRDPQTSGETRQAIASHGTALTRVWRSLFEQALGEIADEEDLVRYAFTTLRSYLTGQLIAGSVADLADDEEQRRLLVRGVAAVIREEAATRRTG